MMLVDVHQSDLPLAGVTVVALEQAVAGPLASRQLADLGARVIKVERVGEGDFARHYDDAVEGLASHFVWLNRGKESIALDLKAAAGRDILHDLVAQADVLLQNLAPGAADRLGLGGADLLQRHPQLIVAGINGYGTAGPRRDRKAYDMLIQAEAGLVSVTGTPETAVKTGIPTSDIAAGMYAAQAILAALLRRARTNSGSVVDVSMFDATIEWMGHPMYLELCAGRQVPRMGLSHAAIAPYDAYPTADGEMLIGVQNDRGWQSLAGDVLQSMELARDPRFATNSLRVAHRHECDAAVAELTRTFDTAVLDERLARAGVPAAQVNDLAGVLQHPQLTARDRWRDIASPMGVLPALLPPIEFTGLELAMGGIPGLGDQTRSLLTELGHDTTAIDDLVRAGVVGDAAEVGAPAAPHQTPHREDH